MMKKILSLLLCMLCLLSLLSCNGKAPAETTAPSLNPGESSGSPSETTRPDAGSTEGEATAPAPTELAIVDGNPIVPIVYSFTAGNIEAEAATAFMRKIAEKTGVYLDFYDDMTPASADTPEILIGDTNRRESIDLKATLDPYEFAIRVTEKKLVIVASDPTTLMQGIEYFFEAFLSQENSTLTTGKFLLSVGGAYTSDGADNSIFWNSLTASDTLVAGYTEEVLSTAPPGAATWPQGGCIKDGCYYQAFIKKDTASNEKNNVVHIVKFDLATGRLLQTSPVLDLNHCNDITYNPKLGLFVVCHNNPYRTKLSYVDPETLTVVGTETIGNSIYSIDYNPTTDRYVVGLSGGQSFCILDADFKVVSRVNDPTPRTKGYTTQGVTSDDRYIYFVLYHKSPNVITVYDWDGKFVTLIELDIGTIEPESIAIVRHEIYIFCGLSGEGRLYRIGDLTPKEQ